MRRRLTFLLILSGLSLLGWPSSAMAKALPGVRVIKVQVKGAQTIRGGRKLLAPALPAAKKCHRKWQPRRGGVVILEHRIASARKHSFRVVKTGIKHKHFVDCLKVAYRYLTLGSRPLVLTITLRARGRLPRAVRGDIRSKLFHRSGCYLFTCKTCRARFRSPKVARRSGYKPHAYCNSAAALLWPARPTVQRGRINGCRRNSDCTWRHYRGCGCPPCRLMWRVAVNRKAQRASNSKWNWTSCRTNAACQRCLWPKLGSKPVCIKGVCTAR